MINLKAQLWVLVLVFCCFCYSNSLADTSAPSYPTTTTPGTIDLDDGTITSPSGGCPSGTSSAYVYGSGSTLRFGECVNTFAVTYAINQALQGSGVSIDKAHYEWKYIHCFNKPGKFCSADIQDRVNTTTGEITDDTYWDELVVVIEITDSNGNVVETKTWTMDTWYEWTTSNAHSTNEIKEGSTYWQIHSDNIEIFNHNVNSGTIRTPNAVGDVRFRISGYDKGNWDGYYGPIIKDLKTWFTYRANPCAQTALYDPSCPGYAAAYAQYQYNTNCSANALYDSGCPGYATAYYNQQCSANPLYDSGCSGYAEAYYNQQCSADPLYDSGCSGYAEAYYTQQCTANPLYDSGCTGYAEAYYTQQCSLDATYDSGCTGYFDAKCDIDALFDVGCTGYQQAYFNQQCLINPQYDQLCNGYIAPVVSDPTQIDDGSGTGDAIVDDVINTDNTPGVILIPVIPEPEPEVPEIVVVDNTQDTITAPAPLTDLDVEIPNISIENIEREVEQEIERELEIVVEVEPETSEPEVVDDVSTEENTEESTTEDTTEETTEEDTTEESTEEESTEEESTEEESTEEESTEEESTEEESTEEESTEEVEEKEEEEKEEEKEEAKEEAKEETVVAKKETKKKTLTKKQKADAKKKKMKEIIKNKLKALAVEMGKAQSLKDQQALQQLIAALINYVPGFNEYGKYNIPGINFYQPEAIYQDKKIPENNRGLLNGLASELLHEKMVDMQYEKDE
jgi:hypothetical protein